MTDTNETMERDTSTDIQGGKLELAGLKVAQSKALGFLDRHQSRREVTCRAGKVHDRDGWVYEIGVTALRTKRNILENQKK